MPIRFSEWIARRSSVVTLLAFLAATAVLTVGFRLTRSDFPVDSLDKRSGNFAPADVRPILECLGDDALGTYLWTEIALDIPYPLAYGGLFAVWISLALGGRAGGPGGGAGRWMLLNLVPVAAALADLMENAVVIVLLARFKAGSAPLLEAVLPPVGRVKGGLIVASAALALGVSVSWLWRRFRRARRST